MIGYRERFVDHVTYPRSRCTAPTQSFNLILQPIQAFPFYNSIRSTNPSSISIHHNSHDMSTCTTENKKDYRACQLVAKELSNIKDLPHECFEHKDIVASFQRRPTKSENSIAFEGMGNAGAAAASARNKGQQNYAQIQRRFTNTRRFTKQDK